MNNKNVLGVELCKMIAQGAPVEDVKAFLAKHDGKEIDLEATINSGRKTAMHFAAIHGKEDLIRLLHSLGANVNARDRAKWTPLHETALHKKSSACLALLECGAKVDAINSDTDTALHVAAHHNAVAVAEYLLEKGNASTSLKNDEHKTPLEAAISEHTLSAALSLCTLIERIDTERATAR